jgi:hypothetical protein
MDYGRWEDENGEPYSKDVKAKAVIGYRMKKLIEAHIQDAQNAASRKANKRHK